MTLRHLTIFRAVCQTESITLAAEHLNMTQPAVRFRQDLCAKLFADSGRPEVSRQ